MSNFPNALADGRYLLVQPLGEGGMASVFRGWDQRLQVWRAVKVLAPQYADKPRLRGRFENEAQTMANLEHKHIVRVYDVGSDGMFAYIVMELLEGGSLVDWLERHGPMPGRLAVDVTLEICLGLSAAHEKGVVHRDIKPHNILITKDGTCRVTDFGIAQVSQNDQSLTKTGAVMGTWGYMAPEQRTNAKGVDARADVYATAATLFTLLTNKLPMDLFFADRDPEMLEGIPEPLQALIIKACDYDRTRRYGSAMELASALADVWQQLPEVPPDTPPLAQPAREAPPIPRPTTENTMIGTPTPAPSRHPTSPGQSQTGVPGGTIVTMEAGDLGAPTMAPSEGATLDRPGPEQHVALYSPPTPGLRTATMDLSNERPRQRTGSSVGMIVAGVVALLAIGLVVVITSSTVATVMAMNMATPERPIEKPIEPPIKPPVVVDTHPPEIPQEIVAPPEVVPDKPPEIAVVPDKPPEKVDAKVVPKIPKNDPRVDPKVDPKVVVPDKPPEKVVITTNPDPPATPQCVRIDPPQAATAGADVIFRATLCVEDGTTPTLFYRSIDGGAYTSQPMNKALGKYTTRVKLDGPTATGIEYFVKAGVASQGSSGSPYQLRPR